MSSRGGWCSQHVGGDHTKVSLQTSRYTHTNCFSNKFSLLFLESSPQKTRQGSYIQPLSRAFPDLPRFAFAKAPTLAPLVSAWITSGSRHSTAQIG